MDYENPKIIQYALKVSVFSMVKLDTIQKKKKKKEKKEEEEEKERKKERKKEQETLSA